MRAIIQMLVMGSNYLPLKYQNREKGASLTSISGQRDPLVIAEGQQHVTTGEHEDIEHLERESKTVSLPR